MHVFPFFLEMKKILTAKYFQILLISKTRYHTKQMDEILIQTLFPRLEYLNLKGLACYLLWSAGYYIMLVPFKFHMKCTTK